MWRGWRSNPAELWRGPFSGLTPTRPARYEPAMTPRVRKFVGMIAILSFVTLYVIVVVTIGEHVPGHWLAQLVFYGVSGTLWGVPLFPLIRWMNREP